MIQGSKRLLDTSDTSDLQMKTDLARKPIVLSLQMVIRLHEIVDSRKFSVMQERELVSKKVGEVLGTVLSTLGVTRV